MLVLLPPSETKARGGDGPPLDLAALSFPGLTATRRRLVSALVRLAGDPAAARAALALSPGQDAEVALNARLRRSPTTPALRRYTGVLYDALDAPSLRGAAAARAHERLLVTSALFGALAAGDPVPAYRLSAGSRLPGIGALAPLWRPALAPALAAADRLTVDLRSSAYAALAPLPGAVPVRVRSERPDGGRAVVSHANKATKGRLARALVDSRAEPADTRGLARVLRRAGFLVEHADGGGLDVVV